MIYLDHSATTPVNEEVFRKMEPYFSEKFGNASSIHSYGLEAFEAVEEARKKVADFLGADSREVVFTSGATESDNLAVFGVAEAQEKEGRKLSGLHFITTSVEHPAVEEPFLKLKRKGAQVTFLPVQSNGVVDLKEVEKAIQDNTVFISMVYVNSEVGAKQPIKKVGELVQKIRAEREKKGDSLPLLFHTDAVQAANFFSCDVNELGVDLMSLSGHKVYGPKGVGALFVRQGVKLVPQQIGGHQENNLRSGTYNVPAIVGIGEALKIAKRDRNKNNAYLRSLQKRLIDGILNKVPQAHLTTDVKNSSPAHVHFIFPGAEGESVLMDLDLNGICVSTGSACASTSLKASSTLAAMGVSKEIVHGAIRMTLGLDNTEEQIDKVLEVLPKVVEKYRSMSPDDLFSSEE